LSKYSDFTITCQGHVLKVHRAFICPQLKPLAACIEGGFKESTIGEITLDHDDPQAVHKMISFFYTQTYTLDETASDALLSHTRIYIIADKYDVPLLKKLSSENFGEAAIDYSFRKSLQMIYDELPESDRGLREFAIEKGWKNLFPMMEVKEFVDLLKENPNIGVDILKVGSQATQDATHYVRYSRGPSHHPVCTCYECC
jgi:hypothetical protein